MKGLSLAKLYYHDWGEASLFENFPDVIDRIAVGLVGPGSECLGFDDEISQDHDFGPGFCLWLTDEDFMTFGAALREWYDGLPAIYRGFSREKSSEAADRTGVMRITDFYTQFTGCPDAPQDEREWLRIPEYLLAQATNGEVFTDPLGEFSRIRRSLLPCYPRDVRLRKLAARLFEMGQAGQYNYPRLLRRGDRVAQSFALSAFRRAALSAIHLLNQRYAPYYKWIYKSAQSLPLMADAVTLLDFPQDLDGQALAERMEMIAHIFTAELQRQSISTSSDCFLVTQAREVSSRIDNPFLRNLHISVG